MRFHDLYKSVIQENTIKYKIGAGVGGLIIVETKDKKRKFY